MCSSGSVQCRYSVGRAVCTHRQQSPQVSAAWARIVWTHLYQPVANLRMDVQTASLLLCHPRTGSYWPEGKCLLNYWWKIKCESLCSNLGRNVESRTITVKNETYLFVLKISDWTLNFVSQRAIQNYACEAVIKSLAHEVYFYRLRGGGGWVPVTVFAKNWYINRNTANRYCSRV
jgi:hypothetical protein